MGTFVPKIKILKFCFTQDIRDLGFMDTNYRKIQNNLVVRKQKQIKYLPAYKNSNKNLKK